MQIVAVASCVLHYELQLNALEGLLCRLSQWRHRLHPAGLVFSQYRFVFCILGRQKIQPLLMELGAEKRRLPPITSKHLVSVSMYIFITIAVVHKLFTICTSYIMQKKIIYGAHNRTQLASSIKKQYVLEGWQYLSFSTPSLAMHAFTIGLKVHFSQIFMHLSLGCCNCSHTPHCCQRLFNNHLLIREGRHWMQCGQPSSYVFEQWVIILNGKQGQSMQWAFFRMNERKACIY